MSQLPVCCSQPSSHRVPGVALSGPRLHGLTVDSGSGRIFVLASGTQAAGGKPTCRAAILTMDGWNGRVLHETPLGNTMEPTSYNAMVVAPNAHRLLALTTGNLHLSPVQNPGTNNRLFVMDTRTGKVVSNLGLPTGARIGTVAVDNATYRAFVSYVIEGAVTQYKIAVVAVTRGVIVRTIDDPAQGAIAVDQHTNRVFLLNSSEILTLDGATGNLIKTVTLPSGYYEFNGFGVDEHAGRLLAVDLGLSPPHSGNPPNPPSIVAVIDTTTGALIKQITAGNGIVAGELAVDPPVGIALSMAYNTNDTRALILSTSDASVRQNVALALPPGGFAWSPPGLVQAAPVYDPRDGTIYGYTSRGIRAITPGRWKSARTVTTNGNILPLALVVDPVTHRGFGLALETSQRDVVQGFCLRSNCR